MTELSKTILIVEDDLMVQTLYRYLLPNHYKLLVTDTVLRAKKIMETNKIDCIILDLALTGDESGLILARFIRQEQKDLKTPILAVTAHAFPVDRQQALDAGCNDYMSKPINENIMLQTIANLISTKSENDID
ncbi:MAG: response regulator [Candidatus Marinimicrobia bacterium]|nr:response regulator [Candidatus Neomarinimicrobiota bacterium]